MARNYSLGKVYMIESPSAGLRYIGSTCGELQKRMNGHRHSFMSHLCGKGSYITSFAVLEHHDATISLLEDYPCERADQLAAREGHHIRNTECVNRSVAGRTPAEYYQDHRAHMIAKAKEHHIANRDLKLQQMKQWRVANKELISQMAKRMVDCPSCGCAVRADSMPRHVRTRKHLLINANNRQDLPPEIIDAVANIAVE
jgi:hypothetical protein